MMHVQVLLVAAYVVAATAQGPLSGSAVSTIKTAGVRYKGYTYTYDIASPVFALGQDACNIIVSTAMGNPQRAVSIYTNGLFASTNTSRVTLRGLVSRTSPTPVNGFGGDLYRSFFSGVVLSSPDDIHRLFTEAVNYQSPAAFIRAQHSIQYMINTKLMLDQWELAITNSARNTPRGRSLAVQALDRAWGFYTGNVADNPLVEPTCDDDISFHVDNWASYTTAQYHPGVAAFVRMTMSDTFNSAVTAVRARNTTLVQQLGHRMLSLQANFGLGALLFATYTMDVATLCNRPILGSIALDFAYNLATTTAAMLHGKGVPEANTTAFMAAAINMGNRTAAQLMYPQFKTIAMDVIRHIPDMDSSLLGELNGPRAVRAWAPFGPIASLTDCPSTLPPT